MTVAEQRVGLELLEERDRAYGGKSRERVIERLDRPLGDVLDIGCGEGASAEALRTHGATKLTGVEVDEHFADIARTRYDEVVAGSAEHVLSSFEPATFDVVLCYDVLEHLYDPWSVLSSIRGLLRPGGRLQISVPNARHKDVWLPLVLNGTFNYQSAGLMDVTHIRFFTLRDAVRSTEAAGFRVTSAGGGAPGSLKRRLAYRLTGGRAAEFVTMQWYIVATPDL